MSSKQQIVIFGAGAIGRGYLPWLFDQERYDFVFVDNNVSLIRQMKERKTYRTYRVKDGKLQEKEIPISFACTPEEWSDVRLENLGVVFINVGPRHAANCAQKVAHVSCPIILCENEPKTVDWIRSTTGLSNVYFAVPDVITSNTASTELLQKDALSVITENGQLFVDERVSAELVGDFERISSSELLDKQWVAKLFLHNTPHCIAAYLGALVGVQYVHEAMQVPAIDEIVAGSMEEMLNELKLRWQIDHDFLEWYAAKELSRFRCQLLFDPISRVAREPLRKLEADGRLLGAAQRCLAQGFIPKYILLGIASAFLFENKQDSDWHLGFMRSALSPDAFVTHILGLRKGEALERIFAVRLTAMLEELEGLRQKVLHAI